MLAFVVKSITQAEFSWVSFFTLVGAVLVGALAVGFWVLHFQKKKKRKRKHRGHGRIKPTLAEVRGLPPVRQEDEVAGLENPPFDP